MIQDVLELTTRLSKENYYREYDNLWFKFPLFFERKALTGKAIALRVLKFLYGEAYKDAKSKFHLFGGKSEESYLEEMLVNRPFKIYLRTDFKKEQYYGRSEFKFAKEIEVNDEDRMEDVLGRIDTRTCELDIRFSKSGADKFAFENLKSNEEFGKKKKSFNNDDTGPVHLN